MAINPGVNSSYILFFQNQTSNAISTPTSFIFPRKAVLKFWGTWNGATVSFQTATPLNNAYFVPVTINAIPFLATSDGQVTLENVVYGDLIRCTITGAGGSTNLNVTAQGI